MNFDIRRPTRTPIIILFTWMGVLLALGAWWLYLVVRQGNILLAHSQTIGKLSNYGKMAIYEGATFFLLLTGLFIYIIVLYSRDIKRYNSLSSFFSSLTHELKTPLASIRLQAEVIKEMEEQQNHQMINKLVGRLTEDVEKLENEMEKILQLSRVERGAPLKLKETEINKYFERFESDPVLKNEINVRLPNKIPPAKFLIDEYALTVILRNLIENSVRHAKVDKNLEAEINIVELLTSIEIHYHDNGAKPELNEEKLTQLFYRGQNQKGSGIGLYLTRKLTEAMSGELEISNKEKLEFTIRIPKS